MSPERWRQIKSILEEALERPADERSVFLAETCASDDELRREVESLLEFDVPDSDFIEDSVFRLTESLLEGAGQAFIGKRFGKYEIISELGAGGMGAVFLAERADGEFRQKVAVKIIKRGMDSGAIVSRFLNERQILATLDHPNIARLIDGGTTENGLPYFVMEYVEGETILEFAQRRGLSIEQRLDLFREVCAAVSFAHRNLVIHRDLKPSNILVTQDGEPKLLDFGIAKLVKTDISDKTATQAFAFTPEYASPEQMMGGRLTTATDIYSLGVILYELLTETRPFSFEDKNFGQIVQTVTQTEPPPPSSAAKANSGKKINAENEIDSTQSINPNSKSLRGDLDNIVLKALKKEPERRYQTVEQFSEDVRRYLKGLPVLARRDTIIYRAEKFARRNPLVVAAAALSFLILVGGSVGVAWQAGIANVERERAERRFGDVRRLANSFIFEIDEEIEKSPVRARELLARRAIEYLDNLAREAEGDMELQSELAAAYEKIGDVQSVRSAFKSSKSSADPPAAFRRRTEKRRSRA
jgi:eukaryotic-like serine/threonine-protein kinase